MYVCSLGAIKNEWSNDSPQKKGGQREPVLCRYVQAIEHESDRARRFVHVRACSQTSARLALSDKESKASCSCVRPLEALRARHTLRVWLSTSCAQVGSFASTRLRCQRLCGHSSDSTEEEEAAVEFSAAPGCPRRSSTVCGRACVHVCVCGIYHLIAPSSSFPCDHFLSPAFIHNMLPGCKRGSHHIGSVM